MKGSLKHLAVGAAGLACLVGVAGCEEAMPVGKVGLGAGVEYESAKMADGAGYHVVTIRLDTPGLRLFVTPKDEGMKRVGMEYRLARVQSEGDWAIGMTLASEDGDLSWVDSNSRAFWFDEQNRLTVERERPPWKIGEGPDGRSECRLAVGGYAFSCIDGELNKWVDKQPDRVTLMGATADRGVLMLAVFDRAGMLDATRVLMERGARDVMMLDGGDSTAMSVRIPGSARPAVVLRGRPVATHFGVRVER